MRLPFFPSFSHHHFNPTPPGGEKVTRARVRQCRVVSVGPSGAQGSAGQTASCSPRPPHGCQPAPREDDGRPARADFPGLVGGAGGHGDPGGAVDCEDLKFSGHIATVLKVDDGGARVCLKLLDGDMHIKVPVGRVVWTGLGEPGRHASQSRSGGVAEAALDSQCVQLNVC